MNKEEALQLLRSQEIDSRITELYQLKSEMIDENIINLISQLLMKANVDTIYVALQVLINAALTGIDISPALPFLQRLFDDKRFPPSRPNYKSEHLSVGGRAANAFTLHYFRRGLVDELQSLILRPDLLGRTAVHTLTAAKTATEIEPFLPLLQKMLAENIEDGLKNTVLSKKRGIASVLAHAYRLKNDWEKIVKLVFHENEEVRLGVIAAIDNWAEGKEDIRPVLSSLIAVFDRSDSDFGATRIAAARALIWLMSRKELKTMTFVRAGIDLIKYAEVKEEIEGLKQFEKQYKNDF